MRADFLSHVIILEFLLLSQPVVHHRFNENQLVAMSSDGPAQHNEDDPNKKDNATNSSDSNNPEKKNEPEEGDDDGTKDIDGKQDGGQGNSGPRPKIPTPPIEIDDEQLPALQEVENVDELSVTYTIGKRNSQTVTQRLLEEHLRELQTHLEDTGDVARQRRDLYDLWEGVETRKETYRDVMRQEVAAGGRKGFGVRTKAAKATVKTAEDAYKKASRSLDKKGRKSVRQYESDALMNAQGRLEDWLYYQNSNNRWMRLRAINPDSRLEVEAERLQRRTPYLLDNYAENSHHDWLHHILNMYDERGVGTQHYREGYKDQLGNDLRTVTEPRQSNPIGPSELHLWTPMTRRRPVGLGRDPNTPWRQRPWDLVLNNDAIEAQRASMELALHASDNVPPAATLVITHEARRQNELARYSHSTASRPTTSNVRTRRTATDIATDDRFKQIQTANGVFIAAKSLRGIG